MGKVKVKIQGNEYTLKGPDEGLIVEAAKEVDLQINTVAEKYKEQPIKTIYTLAALNLAEKLKQCERQSSVDIDFVVQEIKKITLFLIENTNS